MKLSDHGFFEYILMGAGVGLGWNLIQLLWRLIVK